MRERQLEPDRLEQLFARQLLTRRQFVGALAALGVTVSGIEAVAGSAPLSAEAAAPPVPKYLVIIVMDAFRADYTQLAPMPALNALAVNGAIYDRAWVGQVESETPTGHATLSTGSMPIHSGIIGFEWRNPKTNGESLDGWAPGVLSGAFERDLRMAGANSIPLAIKAADPQSTIVALSSEKVYAADAMGGWAADYILYHQRAKTDSHLLQPSGIPGHAPPVDFFSPGMQMRLPAKHFTDWDYLSAVLALASVAAFRPAVLMVNLPGADVYGHPYGGPATPEVMRQIVVGIDRNIGRIVDVYKKAGIYDETLFVITADHGMVPNDRAVDGNTTKAAVREAGAQYFFHTGGTAADIYLHDPQHAASVAQTMLKVPNVAGSYYRTVSGASYSYIPASGMRIDPKLDAAYQYLLSTFAGPVSPDVVAPFRENTIGSAVKSAHGDHGGLNWGAQHIPLIFSGPGVQNGIVSHFPARLMDIAPTVLQALGLPVQGMDGVILADALLSPAAADISRQDGLAQTLTGYQDALIGQSRDNIAEDQKDHQVPPPALPMRP